MGGGALMCYFIVKSVEPGIGAKAGSVVLEPVLAEGCPRVDQTIKFWPDSDFAPQLVVGAKAEATFQTKKGGPRTTGGTWPDEKFLKTWGGVRRGRPGRSTFTPNPQSAVVTPKSLDELLVDIAKAAIAEAAMARVDDVCKTATAYADNMIATIKRGREALS